MGDVSTRLWASLEKWSAVVLLIAGVLFLVSTVVVGLQWLGGMEGLAEGPLGIAGFLGFVVSYVGLLGLYPRLADENPQLARAALGLLLIPVIVILVDLVAVVLGATPPFAGTAAVGAFVLLALGVALLGVISLQSQASSRGVGFSLLVFALGLSVLLGEGLLNGFPTSDPANFVGSGLMVIALFAIGYLLRTESEPIDRAEPAPDTAARR